ncbi:MAG: MerR family transcriptional regulator [Wujia sp.]
MRIGEVAEKTGLSISNIRFYEKKGLIAPARLEESKYRDYTEEDCERLKKIILFRKLNMPIEKLQPLLDTENPDELEVAFRKQLLDLQEQNEMLQSSIDLCNVMLETDAAQDLDIDYYLNYVREEEKSGSKYPGIEQLLDDVADLSMAVFSVNEGHSLLEIWFADKRRSRLKRIIGMLILAVWIALPLSMIGEDLVATGVVRAKILLFCAMWVVIMVYSVIQLRKAKRIKTN